MYAVNSDPLRVHHIEDYCSLANTEGYLRLDLKHLIL